MLAIANKETMTNCPNHFLVLTNPRLISPTLYNPTAAFNFAKLGVPSPVTGSQPAFAGNPFVLQPGLLPVVTSFNAALPAAEYKNGFKNPSGLLPAATS